MSYFKFLPVKPRLRFQDGHWQCAGPDGKVIGFGSTPKQAYSCYLYFSGYKEMIPRYRLGRMLG